MLESYRLKRARRLNEIPIANFTQKRKTERLAISSVVVLMSIIVYSICFAWRAPVIPSTFNKNTLYHIVSTIEFSYASDLLTQQRRDLNAARVPPLYKVNENSLNNATELNNKLIAFFNDNQIGYEASVKDGKQAKFLDEISASLRRSTYFEIAPQDISYIYANASEKEREGLFNRAIFSVRNVLSDGVYQDNDKIFAESHDLLTPPQEASKTQKRAVSETTARKMLMERLKKLGVSGDMAMVLYRIFNQCIIPNIEFDAAKTNMLRNRARAEIKPVIVKVREGETLADNDSINSPLVKEKMRAYKAEIQKRGDSDIANSPKAVNFLLCVLMMTLAALFIIISKTQRNKRPGTILIFCLLLIADLFLQRFIIGWANASVWDETTTALQILIYAIPVIIGPIIQALLFGSYLAFIMAILVSMLSTLMLAEPPAFFVVSLASSVVAIYICDGAQNRYRVIIAGVVYGLVAAFSCLLIGMFSGFPMMIYGQQAIAAFLGGLISSIAVLGVLPIVETIFKCNSNISLLDYTDLNNKKARLLKLLQINAPGTYHHSVMVSYVAEAAAQAVKANSTICRVGALYHDIGKLSKPEFFSENQRDKNPHDMQNPSMSALIIKNHVPEGIAAAEVEKMPRQIIDAISQHHGTSIISYFFSKAKAKAGAKALYPEELDKILREEGIEESMYRHEGRKPQTVENAIIMIADSCEAASRSMKVVTKHGIETLVEAIVKGKMTDGQFDECPITVKQLSKIKKSVSRTLLSMLHSRVDYKQQ